MTPDQFRRVRSLFDELRALPAGEQAARLEAACADDPVVRDELRELLRLEAADAAARRTMASGGKQAASAPPTDPLLGASIGPYRIRGVLGQGGMGSVYEAEHERSKQVVALKLIRSGLTTPELLRRFEFELQVLARLEHPGIARIYHADTADVGGGPQPYFAMELVRGQNLIQYATGQKLTVRQRLELAARIADAVQYAHQQGVIHRDLKPGNIFVTADGQPKILDFGLARATDSDVQSTTLQTDIGQLIGTLPYMSPEQAGGDPNQIDTRSDVYALGVVIYELLTGRLPYLLERRMIHEAVRIIKEEEPTRLSSLNKTLRGDVETIVGKALEKEKDRRYASANALAADIRRYLNDEPIAARPPSATYQLSKFARRNKALVGGVAATFIALVAGLATSIVLYRQAETQAERAIAAEARELIAGLATSIALYCQGETQAERVAIAAYARERGERERAETALQEVTKSRDETKQVAEFQENMLAQIDPTTAGYRLTEDVNRRYLAALEKLGLPEPERIAQADAFRQQWLRVNPTDVALALIDETILTPAVKAIDEKFKDQPIVDAQLREVLAERYHGLGLYGNAMPLQESALATRRRVLGEEHPDTLRSINNMGYLLQAQGKLAEAEPYYREALETRRRVLGEEHPDTLTSINNIGMLLQSLGKLTEAEPYVREALDKRRRVLGEEHPHTLTSINNMGFLLQAQGNLADAEPYFREALEKCQRVLGEDHPDTLTMINNMGAVLEDQGKLAEAELYYREALESGRRVLGVEHPNTLTWINNMGSLLQRQGKHQQAIDLLAPAEPAARQAFASGNMAQLAIFLSALGRARSGQDYDDERFTAAEANLTEAHAIFTHAPGKQEKSIRECAQGLIDLYVAWDQAEPDQGYDAKAAEWRAKLDAWQASTQPAATQPVLTQAADSRISATDDSATPSVATQPADANRTAPGHAP